MDKCMETVLINGKMGLNIRELTSTERNRDMGYFGTVQAKSMLECGVMVNNKGMGRFLPQMEIFRSKEYGKMESSRKLMKYKDRNWTKLIVSWKIWEKAEIFRIFVGNYQCLLKTEINKWGNLTATKLKLKLKLNKNNKLWNYTASKVTSSFSFLVFFSWSKEKTWPVFYSELKPWFMPTSFEALMTWTFSREYCQFCLRIVAIWQFSSTRNSVRRPESTRVLSVRYSSYSWKC